MRSGIGIMKKKANYHDEKKKKEKNKRTNIYIAIKINGVKEHE